MPNSTKALPSIRLSDTQSIALSKAAQREDGAIVLSERLTGSAAKRFIDALIDKGLAREIRAKTGMPIVRRDEDKGAYALIITKTGRVAINADDGSSEKRSPANAAKKAGVKQITSAKRSAAAASAKTVRGTEASKESETSGSSTQGAPREGSKTAGVIGLLSRPVGASLEELIEATNWLPHTTRAALTGLRKRGFDLERTRANGVTTYRILPVPNAEPRQPGEKRAKNASTPSTEAAVA
jgi:hypothetical protein